MCVHTYTYMYIYICIYVYLHIHICIFTYMQSLSGSEVKASACNAGDLSSILGSGRSPGEGNGNPLQYSCLENPMDGGTWWATVHGVVKSRTRLSDLLHFHLLHFIHIYVFFSILKWRQFLRFRLLFRSIN